jgi:kumamolisin
MTPVASFVSLGHSQVVHTEGARRSDEGYDHDERIQVTVVLRARTSRDERRKAIQRLVSRLPGERTYPSAEEFIRLHGATAEDIEAVASFAAEQGLAVKEKSPGRRCVVLIGRVRDFDHAFGVTSGRYRVGGVSYRSYAHPVHVPRNLAGIVMGVLGLDDRQLFEHDAFTHAPFRFTDHEKVMKEYEFPVESDGRGQCIGIISLGGGFRHEDMKGCLAAGQEVQVVELDGQRNLPSDRKTIEAIWEAGKGAYDGHPGPLPDIDRTELTRFKWTVEVTADVQHAIRFAAGANIVVYFAPGTMQGKYTAFTTALVDRFAPAVLSSSWGAHEDKLSRNHIYLMDDVFSFAALRGVTLCFSSGDDGDGSVPITSGAPPQKLSAHFPASSPYVLSCGGTMPAPAGDSPREVVWKEEFGEVARMASGGGVSGVFRTPWWQSAEMIERRAGGHRGRGVPDVAGKADVMHGYRITVGGIDMPIGGTSSAAPMWAGLIARINQKLGRPVGFVNALFYRNRDRFEGATRSITEGDNGAYRASAGWDACTGWGTPRGSRLLRAFTRS